MRARTVLLPAAFLLVLGLMSLPALGIDPAHPGQGAEGAAAWWGFSP